MLTRSGGASLHYRFSNADGKEWVMPASHLHVAMNLYQPSGWKGKLLRAVFPWGHWFAPVRWALRARKERCRLSAEVQELAERLFPLSSEFSVFGGTPSVHQKITIQLSRGKHILGYLKLCSCEAVYELFVHEREILSRLQQAGVGQVPRCLGCGKLESGIGYFAQDTCKTLRSAVSHEWGKLQQDFLCELQTKTSCQTPFERMSYYLQLKALESHPEWYPPAYAPMLAGALRRTIGENAGRKMNASVSHGDFTPWNTFVEKGRLFVFDWEYASASCPLGMDEYHFLISTGIFEKGLNASALYELLRQHGRGRDWQSVCRFYLLDIIGRFILRERKPCRLESNRCMGTWLELLKRLTV